MDESTGKFNIIKITSIAELTSGKLKELPESDLCIQTDNDLIQFKYIEKEENIKHTIIKPGCFTMVSTQFGMKLQSFELRQYDLLKTINNTSIILNESNKFFSRLNVYTKRNRDPKRAVLLHSPPGIGKSCAINEICKTLLKEEGTTVIFWDTNDTTSSSVNRFFLNNSQFHKDVKKFILVIEDIGGGSIDRFDERSARGADTSLLNLLDGVGEPFKKVPTFIIATTNNPETTVEALIDRPGRFDKIIELSPPKEEECVELLKFIAKKEELTDDEKEACKIAAKEKFSIAHIQEMVDRSDIDDITILEATKQLADHKQKFKNSFIKVKNKTIGIR